MQFVMARQPYPFFRFNESQIRLPRLITNMKLKFNFIDSNFGETKIEGINEDRKILLARLIGLLLTDGSLSQIKKTKVWRISFISNSEELVNEFEKLAFDLFGLRFRKVLYKGAIEIKHTINSEFAKELLSYSPTYRTLVKDSKETEAKIPEFIRNNQNLAREFLKYAFTGDGTIIFNIGKARYGYRFDRCVKLYCEHSELRKQYFELLQILSYKPTMLKDAVLLRKPENIQKFAKEIGFVEDVKISGNGLWKGITKADLLQFAANSYNLKPSKLGKTKSDIHTNLVNLILRSGHQMI